MSNNTTSKSVAKYSDFFGEISVEEIKLNDPMESYTVHAEAAYKLKEIAPTEPGYLD